MRPFKIIIFLTVFLFSLTSLSQARSGGHGGSRGSSGSHGGRSHVSGGGHHSGIHSGGFRGRGTAYFYPRAYWGPSPSYWYWGWPTYYPPAYYYTPPPTYDYTMLFPLPHLDTSNSPPQENFQPPAQGWQVFIYPRQGQSVQQQMKDRDECRAWALQQTGVDLTTPPPAGMTESQLLQKRADYYRALEACLDARGYSVR